MRVAAILACVLAATVATACQGGGSGGGSSATAAATTPAQTPMRFRRMQSMANQAAALASRGDAASLRAMSARLSNEGLH